MACGLSCPAAWEILVPWPGVELVSPALQGRFLAPGLPVKSLVSTFWLLWIVLLWTNVYLYLFSVLSDIYIVMGLLGHLVILCLVFWGITKLFPPEAESFHLLTSNSQGFQFLHILPNIWASLVAQVVKNLAAMQETRVPSLGQEDPLEKERATHSSILAWRIPRTEEPGGLQSMGSQRVRHGWAANTHTSLTFVIFLKNKKTMDILVGGKWCLIMAFI